MSEQSMVITVRVSPVLASRLEREARRRRRRKSTVLRQILEQALGADQSLPDPAQEARRQSLLVSGRASERAALAFVDHIADRRGWR